MRFARVILSQNYSFKGKKTGLLEFSPPGIGSKVLRKSAKQTQSSFSPTLTFLHGSTSNTYSRGTTHKYIFIFYAPFLRRPF